MRKQVILKMQGNQYPFGQLNQASNKTKIDSCILVRKIHDTHSLQQRKNLLDSIHTIKNIKNDYLMKIQNVLEQDNSIHILYQYVPNSLLKNIQNMTTVSINIIKDQLLDLGKNLAQVGFKIQWDSKNIGINDKMQVKYYLDLNKINVDQISGKIKLLKLHTQNIGQIIDQLSKGIKGAQKIAAINKNNQIISPEATKLQNARAANSIQSNTDMKRYKFPQFQQNDKIKTSQQNKGILNPKVSQKLHLKQLQVPSLSLKKQRTDWKQIDHNFQFMTDFINVLDDNKSQMAKSKYLSQDQQRQQWQQQQIEQQFIEMELPTNGKNYIDEQEQQQQGQEEQQIVWISATEEEQQNYQQQKINNEGQDQEVVWVDYQDIKSRAQQAIKRSTNALTTFKSILCKNK